MGVSGGNIYPIKVGKVSNSKKLQVQKILECAEIK